MNDNTPLPIQEALPELIAALDGTGVAVLVAPPGAGKTTGVPLAMLDHVAGKIIMLEPRRLAARAAAERLAATLGEGVGARVGYRMRGESVSGQRIEVVTEGILTRMIQSDPGLDGIGAVIFDEFHERSLNADLGLALVWEARQALRPDLWVLVMSATLDAEPVADLLAAPVIRSEGRAFPVTTRWLDRPLPARARFDTEMAALIRQAESETRDMGGTILAFLPGEGEINRVAALIKDLPEEIAPLYGAMDFAAQRRAIVPTGGRKIVLATSIAETSLTIANVRVVVDGGRARRARFDPGTGMSRLVTERASRAEAEQRRGRAGRVAEGVCYRLWARAEEGALPAFAPPEIEVADLSGLALELAAWGGDEGLAFLTPPPEGALAEARALLTDLGALDKGTLTDHGRVLAGMPLHPRLSHMLALAGAEAAPLAAILADRDPLRGAPVDLNLRLAALADPRGFGERHPFDVNRPTLDRIRAEAKRLRRYAPDNPPFKGLGTGAMLALAYPDRIGLRRKGDQPRYILSGGKGAVLPASDPMQPRLIVAADLDGDTREAGIRLAAPVTEAELRMLYDARITWQDRCEWSRRDNRVIARRQECLGALILNDRLWTDAPDDAIAKAAVEGLRLNGLPWTKPAARLRARLALMGEDMSDAALLDESDWLLPHLTGRRSLADLRALDLSEALRQRQGWAAMAQLDDLVPAHFITPLGRKVPIDYDGDAPTIEVKLQELFGLTTHPLIGAERTPLRVVMLSPGGKPVQVTMDVPGFWDSSYPDVRKDMRGHYPRHPWPENPREAEPTQRAKPRGT